MVSPPLCIGTRRRPALSRARAGLIYDGVGVIFLLHDCGIWVVLMTEIAGQWWREVEEWWRFAAFNHKLSMTPEITESYFLNRDRLVECRPEPIQSDWKERKKESAAQGGKTLARVHVLHL